MNSTLVRSPRLRRVQVDLLSVRQVRPILLRQVEQRPADHVVGLDAFPDGQTPPDVLGPNAQGVERYLAVVEDVVEDVVTLTYHEHPGGRQLIGVLSVQEHFHGTAPAPLSFFRVWAWLDTAEGESNRIHLERWLPLSEDEQRRLRDIAASIEE